MALIKNNFLHNFICLIQSELNWLTNDNAAKTYFVIRKSVQELLLLHTIMPRDLNMASFPALNQINCIFVSGFREFS